MEVAPPPKLFTLFTPFSLLTVLAKLLYGFWNKLLDWTRRTGYPLNCYVSLSTCDADKLNNEFGKKLIFLFLCGEQF